MSTTRNTNVVDRIKSAAMTAVASDPSLVKMLLAGGAGALLGGGIGARVMHGHDEAARERTKNTAFGAGVATGLAGPGLVGNLNARLNPQPAVISPEVML